MGDPGGAAVRFAVLGPLRTWRGDAGLSLGSVQQRVVLAVLLLHANRPVGRGQLIDAVWGSAAPASAVNVLARHAGGLRRVLEPIGPPVRRRSCWCGPMPAICSACRPVV